MEGGGGGGKAGSKEERVTQDQQLLYRVDSCSVRARSRTVWKPADVEIVKKKKSAVPVLQKAGMIKATTNQGTKSTLKEDIMKLRWMRWMISILIDRRLALEPVIFSITTGCNAGRQGRGGGGGGEGGGGNGGGEDQHITIYFRTRPTVDHELFATARRNAPVIVIQRGEFSHTLSV